MGTKLKAAGAGAAVIGLVILGLAIALGLVVLAIFMLIWNISDIQNVGPNFWNIAWITVAGLYLLGVVAAFFKRV